MKILTLIVIVAFISSCTNSSIASNNEITEDQPRVHTEEDGWNYQEARRDQLDSLLIDVCAIRDIEFFDFYPLTDSIASGKYEKLILVDSLKTRGFKITKSGRGNWMEGPRIVSLTISNNVCECQVDKLYYSTDLENQFNVTERIKCSKISR